jgi:hypothetical protein
MPKSIIQYRVFIASPGGLDEERRAFKTVDEYSKREARPRGVLFEPFGWEDTLPGRGRPQHLINADIEQSDYVVFILHDRWGSPTGSGTRQASKKNGSLRKDSMRKSRSSICRFSSRRLMKRGLQTQATN